jgi:EmrB/QacA subfamily drug resistance transporter
MMLKPHQRFAILFATIVGSSMVFIDGTIVSLALPRMQNEFAASGAQAQWVVESYTLVLGALMLLGGSLGDRYGRKRVFFIGTIIFTVASVLCAIAPSMNFVIFARVIQGIGGMLLAPASLALIGAHFEGEERGKAIGTWSAMTAITATIGPLAGGILIDHFTWRSVFYINIPLAVLVVVATMFIEDKRPERETQRLDYVGAALVTFGFGLLVFGIINAESARWTQLEVWLPTIAGILLLIAFVPYERRIKDPLVPPGLFASRPFVALNAATFLLYGALGSFFFFFPFLLVQVYGYSVTVASFALLPAIALISLLSRMAGGLAVRFGARPMIAIGATLAGIGFALFGLLQHGSSYWTSFFPGAVVMGLGMSMVVSPLTTGVIDTATEEHVGMASGFNNAVSRVAGLLAIAALGAILSGTFNATLNARLDAAHIPPQERQQVETQRDRLAGAQLADPKLKQLVLDSYADGFKVIAIVCAIMAIASSGIVLVGLTSTRPRETQGRRTAVQ